MPSEVDHAVIVSLREIEAEDHQAAHPLLMQRHVAHDSSLMDLGDILKDNWQHYWTRKLVQRE